MKVSDTKYEKRNAPGVGNYYGVGVGPKIGTMVSSYMNSADPPKKKRKKPPLSLV